MVEAPRGRDLPQTPSFVLQGRSQGHPRLLDDAPDPFVNPLSRTIFKEKYSQDGLESWARTARRVVTNVCRGLLTDYEQSELIDLIYQRKFIPGGRYLYAAGREYHPIMNCYLYRAGDSREAWASLLHETSMALMSGGGVGGAYCDVRPRGSIIRRTGGKATGPCALMQMVNEVGRQIMNGGNRRAAIWAGLSWWHQDIFEFLGLKNHSEELRALKERDISFPLPMELTNISVIYDAAFFEAFDDAEHPKHSQAVAVWNRNCRQAFETAEPGFSINFKNARESLRNACTEVVSEDNNDRCNLGTVWMSHHKDLADFAHTVRYATLFLVCGGIYTDSPTPEVERVGKQNNRIGLGLGGMHDWLLQRGAEYEVTSEMHQWLSAYREENEFTALDAAIRFGVPEPKGKRAIAPTGTISFIAETTTGIEPLFCAAYRRRYFTPEGWKAQYVVDGAVKRLVEQGVPLELIERSDAYGLSFEQRVKFQADVQDYVDMSISSTCNMDPWGSERNNEENVQEKADILMKYARRLRGFTTYPDGCRGGQPLTKVPVAEALAHEGMVFEEKIRECTNGVCGL